MNEEKCEMVRGGNQCIRTATFRVLNGAEEKLSCNQDLADTIKQTENLIVEVEVL